MDNSKSRKSFVSEFHEQKINNNRNIIKNLYSKEINIPKSEKNLNSNHLNLVVEKNVIETNSDILNTTNDNLYEENENKFHLKCKKEGKLICKNKILEPVCSVKYEIPPDGKQIRLSNFLLKNSKSENKIFKASEIIIRKPVDNKMNESIYDRKMESIDDKKLTGQNLFNKTTKETIKNTLLGNSINDKNKIFNKSINNNSKNIKFNKNFDFMNNQNQNLDSNKKSNNMLNTTFETVLKNDKDNGKILGPDNFSNFNNSFNFSNISLVNNRQAVNNNYIQVLNKFNMNNVNMINNYHKNDGKNNKNFPENSSYRSTDSNNFAFNLEESKKCVNLNNTNKHFNNSCFNSNNRKKNEENFEVYCENSEILSNDEISLINDDLREKNNEGYFENNKVLFPTDSNNFHKSLKINTLPSLINFLHKNRSSNNLNKKNEIEINRNPFNKISFKMNVFDDEKKKILEKKNLNTIKSTNSEYSTENTPDEENKNKKSNEIKINKGKIISEKFSKIKAINFDDQLKILNEDINEEGISPRLFINNIDKKIEIKKNIFNKDVNNNFMERITPLKSNIQNGLLIQKSRRKGSDIEENIKKYKYNPTLKNKDRVIPIENKFISEGTLKNASKIQSIWKGFLFRKLFNKYLKKLNNFEKIYSIISKFFNQKNKERKLDFFSYLKKIYQGIKKKNFQKSLKILNNTLSKKINSIKESIYLKIQLSGYINKVNNEKYRIIKEIEEKFKNALNFHKNVSSGKNLSKSNLSIIIYSLINILNSKINLYKSYFLENIKSYVNKLITLQTNKLKSLKKLIMHLNKNNNLPDIDSVYIKALFIYWKNLAQKYLEMNKMKHLLVKKLFDKKLKNLLSENTFNRALNSRNSELFNKFEIIKKNKLFYNKVLLCLSKLTYYFYNKYLSSQYKKQNKKKDILLLLQKLILKNDNLNSKIKNDYFRLFKIKINQKIRNDIEKRNMKIKTSIRRILADKIVIIKNDVIDKWRNIVVIHKKFSIFLGKRVNEMDKMKRKIIQSKFKLFLNRTNIAKQKDELLENLLFKNLYKVIFVHKKNSIYFFIKNLKFLSKWNLTNNDEKTNKDDKEILKNFFSSFVAKNCEKKQNRNEINNENVFENDKVLDKIYPLKKSNILWKFCEKNPNIFLRYYFNKYYNNVIKLLKQTLKENDQENIDDDKIEPLENLIKSNINNLPMVIKKKGINSVRANSQQIKIENEVKKKAESLLVPYIVKYTNRAINEVMEEKEGLIIDSEASDNEFTLKESQEKINKNPSVNNKNYIQRTNSNFENSANILNGLFDKKYSYYRICFLRLFKLKVINNLTLILTRNLRKFLNNMKNNKELPSYPNKKLDTKDNYYESQTFFTIEELSPVKKKINDLMINKLDMDIQDNLDKSDYSQIVIDLVRVIQIYIYDKDNPINKYNYLLRLFNRWRNLSSKSTQENKEIRTIDKISSKDLDEKPLIADQSSIKDPFNTNKDEFEKKINLCFLGKNSNVKAPLKFSNITLHSKYLKKLNDIFDKFIEIIKNVALKNIAKYFKMINNYKNSSFSYKKENKYLEIFSFNIDLSTTIQYNHSNLRPSILNKSFKFAEDYNNSFNININKSYNNDNNINYNYAKTNEINRSTVNNNFNINTINNQSIYSKNATFISELKSDEEPDEMDEIRISCAIEIQNFWRNHLIQQYILKFTNKLKIIDNIIKSKDFKLKNLNIFYFCQWRKNFIKLKLNDSVKLLQRKFRKYLKKTKN